MLPDPFSYESNRETDKVESFADDKTVTFLATREGLQVLCSLLDQFSNISGLSCNLDKSALMYIGSDQPLPEYALQYGFKVVDHITILGMKIKKTLENLSECHIVTEQKKKKNYKFLGKIQSEFAGEDKYCEDPPPLTNKLLRMYYYPRI